MRRRRHEERVFGILGFIQGERAIQPERAVPRASRFIDGIIEVDKPGDGWGPLDPFVANRVVLVEHYSRAPGITACVRAVAKLAHLVDEWWRDLDANHRKKHSQPHPQPQLRPHPYSPRNLRRTPPRRVRQCCSYSQPTDRARCWPGFDHHPFVPRASGTHHDRSLAT